MGETPNPTRLPLSCPNLYANPKFRLLLVPLTDWLEIRSLQDSLLLLNKFTRAIHRTQENIWLTRLRINTEDTTQEQLVGRDAEGKVCWKMRGVSYSLQGNHLPSSPGVHQPRSPPDPILWGFYGVFITEAWWLNRWPVVVNLTSSSSSSREFKGRAEIPNPLVTCLVPNPGNQPHPWVLSCHLIHISSGVVGRVLLWITMDTLSLLSFSFHPRVSGALCQEQGGRLNILFLL